MRVAAFVLVSALLAAAELGDEARPCGKPCREHPGCAGTCFTIRGRMSLWNGNPSVRIWRVGTTRVLGVSEHVFRLEGFCNLPPEIAARLAWDTDLFADFTVCPFTKAKPGEMQLVCVEAATNISVRRSTR